MECLSPRSKRINLEVEILSTNPDVQSYFLYESSTQDEKSRLFYIYGYLLPRTEPYKYGSFKVFITIPEEYPFKLPNLQLLTYIYHPTILNDISTPRFCCNCNFAAWKPTTHISEWLEHYVNIIDRQDDHVTSCTINLEATNLYKQNRVEYEKKVQAMIMKYSYPRSNQSIISLKFAVRQIIRKQLHFKSSRIDQLLLPTNLKEYLN